MATVRKTDNRPFQDSNKSLMSVEFYTDPFKTVTSH